MAEPGRAVPGLAAALEALREAVLSASPEAVTAAAAQLAAELRTAERNPPPRSELEKLAALSRETGAVLALRQSAVHSALTRLTGTPQLYDRGGRSPITSPSRRRASA